MYRHGWFQVAFQKDLTGQITPLHWGDRKLMAIERDGDVKVFDAVCPHRGANLAYGGELQGDAIRCPFHHYRIGLGGESEDGFRCREYPTLLVAGALFIRLSDQTEPDLPSALNELMQDHTFVTGFELPAATTVEMIIENGFDNAHFKAVHGILNRPDFTVSAGDLGELVVEGVFEVPSMSPRDPGPAVADYKGRAFGPGVFLAKLSGQPPFNYSIITTASPEPIERTSTIRLTLCLPAGEDGAPPHPRLAAALVAASRDGLESDRKIWERLELDAPNKFTKLDDAALAFADYCAGFREVSAPGG